MVLLKKWLLKKKTKYFVFTIKFAGTDSYHYLEAAKVILNESDYEYDIKRLVNNKNEVTAFGWRKDLITS
jgi:hypothetical protein